MLKFIVLFDIYKYFFQLYYCINITKIYPIDYGLNTYTESFIMINEKSRCELLMEMDEKWQTGHKYLDRAEYLAWRGEPLKLPKTATKVHQIS